MRLGLNLGPKSIGWCLFDNDSIVDIGVRIFPDGRDPKTGSSLAVHRRQARSARRTRDRSLGRKNALLRHLIACGLLPEDANTLKEIERCDPYALRVRALDEKLALYEIGRVIFHLNQRRGYRSISKGREQSDESDVGPITHGIEALTSLMEAEKARTVGEFLARREKTRIRMHPEAKHYDFYPDRRHYLAEFEAIWSAQAVHHPDVLTHKAKRSLRRIIFYQRPRKSPERVWWSQSAGESQRSADKNKLPFYGDVLSQRSNSLEADASGGQPKGSDVTDPSLHIAFNQLRRLIDAIIRKYGRPDEIHFELSNDLKLNRKEIAERDQRRKIHRKEAELDSRELRELKLVDYGHNRKLLRLWKHLNPDDPSERCCPYCGEPIPLSMLGSGQVDIGHIIPYSRSMDDSLGNKIVAHVSCHRDKGSVTPQERWGDTPQWSIIQAQAERQDRPRQWRLTCGPDNRQNEHGRILARQLNDTRYRSRLTAAYLSWLYSPSEGQKVFALTGQLTKTLRRQWQLNDILPDHQWAQTKNPQTSSDRLDHRHHAIDAAVAGLLTTDMVGRILQAAARADIEPHDINALDISPPWPNFRDDLQSKVAAITVYHRSDHMSFSKHEPNVSSSRLHKVTAYGFTGRRNAQDLPIVVARKPFLSLTPQDLADPGRMPDHDLQDRLRTATNGKKGKDFEQALRRFANLEGPYRGIRRVRVTEALNVIPIFDAAGRAYKGMKGDSNVRFDVWRMPDGKWITKWRDRDNIQRSSVISSFEAHQHELASRRPHPAAKKILSLHQNDLVAVERDGGPRQIMRVVKFALKGEIVLAEHNEAGPLKARNDLSKDPFRYFTSSAEGLKKAKARQIRIDDLGRIYDPGPRE